MLLENLDDLLVYSIFFSIRNSFSYLQMLAFIKCELLFYSGYLSLKA